MIVLMGSGTETAPEAVDALVAQGERTTCSARTSPPTRTSRLSAPGFADLRRALEGIDDPEAATLAAMADALVKKSVWILGGDGWAYDIGFGGLDHVIASHHDVNVLVLDTEVYSNTGGQQSKATPLGAAAKFAATGKTVPKKDLGLIATMYGHVYVAPIAFGAKMPQTVRAMQEAEAYPGPSLIIAYSHCIAHGYDMALQPLRAVCRREGAATDRGRWPRPRCARGTSHPHRGLIHGSAHVVPGPAAALPDFDIDALTVSPALHLSTSAELLPRLHWTALLAGRLRASLATTGGVHTAADIVKATMAGADAVQMVSALLMRGPNHVDAPARRAASVDDRA